MSEISTSLAGGDQSKLQNGSSLNKNGVATASTHHDENQYLDLIRDILQNGFDKSDRTGTGTLSVFGRQIRFNLRDGCFPLLTTKKVIVLALIYSRYNSPPFPPFSYTDVRAYIFLLEFRARCLK